MVTTDSKETADRIRSLREHGGAGYIHREVGFNSRMDALQAGFLRVKLACLDGWHRGRQKSAAFYDRVLPDLPGVITPFIEEKASSVYNQYTIKAEDRDELLKFLRSREIGCAVYYPLPLHLQECFSCLNYSRGDFPVSEEACEKVISIPVFGELTEDELHEVSGAIGEFYSKEE